MESVTFVVNETPYACWDWELQRKNLEFLDGIDAEYFKYAAEANLGHLEGDNKHRAALALRLSYSQGLETLLALLCSLVQSPECVIGWMLSYKNSELRNVVRKISDREDVYSMLKDKPVTWELLARHVHSPLNFDEEKRKWIQKGFKHLWSQFAHDFLDESSSNEYNSAKHGMRARAGGFYLAVGPEENPGVPAPPEKMQSLGGSEFGTSFFIRERIVENNNTNFRPRRHSRNWHPENLANGLILLSTSINNVVDFLRMINGVKPEKCRFMTPNSEAAFEQPWKHSVGVNNASFDLIIKPSDISPFAKKDILSTY